MEILTSQRLTGRHYVSGGVETIQQQVYELHQDLFLKQHVDFPTRYIEGQESSTLHLIFTIEDYMFDNLRSCAPLGKSDHLDLIWTYQIYTGIYSRSGKSKVYNYMKGHYESMKRELELLDWESEMDGKSVGRMWSGFKSKFHAARDKYIKEKKNKIITQTTMDQKTHTESSKEEVLAVKEGRTDRKKENIKNIKPK